LRNVGDNQLSIGAKPAAGKLWWFAVVGALAPLAVASTCNVTRASATTTIESFGASPSTTQAGGHPDLGISFALDTSEDAETAESITFNAPTGIALEPNGSS
jgi:hypothetical protein